MQSLTFLRQPPTFHRFIQVPSGDTLKIWTEPHAEGITGVRAFLTTRGGHRIHPHCTTGVYGMHFAELAVARCAKLALAPKTLTVITHSAESTHPWQSRHEFTMEYVNRAFLLALPPSVERVETFEIGTGRRLAGWDSTEPYSRTDRPLHGRLPRVWLTTMMCTDHATYPALPDSCRDRACPSCKEYEHHLCGLCHGLGLIA